MEIREPERLTPVVGEADVIVVGSGPGGLSAAIAAATAVAAAAAAHPATADPPPRIAVPWTSEATIAARTSIAAAC